MSRPLHVLVTRPAGQHQALVARLTEAGFRVSHQGALHIEALPLSPAARQQLLDIDQYHAVFFVSVNAARLALEQLEVFWPQWPAGVHWLAVGPATAETLALAGLPVEMPRTGFDSEAVLALDCLRELPGKRVLICGGEGGRQLLADTLRLRGAEVDRIVLYRRVCAAGFAMPAPPPELVLVTSLQSWQCIAAQVDPVSQVVVPSERVAETVRQQHGRVMVAASATDDDMLDACLSFAAKTHC